MKEYNVYIIEIEDKFMEEVMDKILSNLYRLFQREIKKNEMYHSICFVMGVSNTDSKSAKITFCRNNKRGRPKRIVTGHKIEWHIHIYVFCSEKGISSFCNRIKDILSTKKDYKVILASHNSVNAALKYTIKQCEHVWSYGDFYFKNLVASITKNVYK